MDTHEQSTPQATEVAEDIEPQPRTPDILQAFQIADELVDGLWDDLLDAIRYRDKEAYETAASRLRDCYFFMSDSLLAYKRGELGVVIAPEQLERIEDQADICRKCHVRLGF